MATLLTLALAVQAITPVDLAGQTADVFWDQFTAVQSVERVTQARLKEDGRILSNRTTEFDYVALLKPRASAVAIEESRVARFEVEPDEAHQFLLTSGFPVLMLLFHPDYRNKFDFQDSPGSADLPGVVRVAFKSKAGERSLSAVKFNDRFYPIFWRGVAWIEKSTGSVLRIEASLDQPMDDIGLSSLQAEVEYHSIPLANAGVRYRLPSRVTVTVRTPRQQWRNVHEFSQYKLFTVTTVTRGDSSEKDR